MKFMAQIFVLSIAVALAASTAGAIGISNGDFGSGLDGWTFTGNVSVNAAGQAILAENPTGSFLTSLEQQFTMPAGTTGLSFFLQMTSQGEATEEFMLDAVLAHLLAPATGQSLFPQTDDPLGGGDPFFYFFYQDTHGDVTAPSAFLGIAQDVITLRLPPQSGQTEALLRFELLGSDNGLDTTVAIDNVALTQGIIPEPLTLAGVFCGLSGLTAYLRRRKIAC